METTSVDRWIKKRIHTHTHKGILLGYKKRTNSCQAKLVDWKGVKGVLGGSAVKNLPAHRSRGRHGFDPCVGEIPWRRAWQPPPTSCQENPMDRGCWWAMVHRVAKSQTRLKRLGTHSHKGNCAEQNVRQERQMPCDFTYMWNFKTGQKSKTK